MLDRSIDQFFYHGVYCGELLPMFSLLTLKVLEFLCQILMSGQHFPKFYKSSNNKDVHLHSFGIQEWAFRSDNEREIFDGIPEVRDGYVFPNDRPGLGIDLDERVAARFQPEDRVIEWTQSRLPDGGMSRP